MAFADTLHRTTVRQARPGPLSAARLAPRRRVVAQRSSNNNRHAAASAQESRNVLEAFFVGHALAEVLKERLGAAVGDALADFGKWDAETRQAIREFQDEVISRAQREMLASAGTSDASSGGGGGSASLSGMAAVTPDLPALVDDLRAEVASTRAVLQQLKLRQKQPPPWR